MLNRRLLPALLLLLTCIVVNHAEQQESDVIVPGKVPPQFKEAFPMLEARGLYWGAVQYTPETIAALSKEGHSKSDDKWFERRTKFYAALMNADGFAGYPGHDGKSELEPANCGDEFIVLSTPNAKIDAATVARLAGENGMELLEFVQMPAAEGLRTIDPGFSEDALKKFWKPGRKVTWKLIEPTKQVPVKVRVNGVEEESFREETTSGTEKLECKKIDDAVWIGRTYSLTTRYGNTRRSKGGGGTAVGYTWNHLLIDQPRKSYYISLPLLSALSTREETTLKIGDKEYACRKFTMRKSYTGSDGKVYGVGEFYFCDEVPGVALKAVWTSHNGDETKTWSFTFESTTAPE